MRTRQRSETYREVPVLHAVRRGHDVKVRVDSDHSSPERIPRHVALVLRELGRRLHLRIRWGRRPAAAAGIRRAAEGGGQAGEPEGEGELGEHDIGSEEARLEMLGTGC